MIIVANRSSISLSGFCSARNSASPKASRFFKTRFVSDTTAAALNTARSCAIWYSGRAYNSKSEKYIDQLQDSQLTNQKVKKETKTSGKIKLRKQDFRYETNAVIAVNKATCSTIKPILKGT